MDCFYSAFAKSTRLNTFQKYDIANNQNISFLLGVIKSIVAEILKQRALKLSNNKAIEIKITLSVNFLLKSKYSFMVS